MREGYCFLCVVEPHGWTVSHLFASNDWNSLTAKAAGFRPDGPLSFPLHPHPCCETSAPTRSHVWRAAFPGALRATLWWVGVSPGQHISESTTSQPLLAPGEAFCKGIPVTLLSQYISGNIVSSGPTLVLRVTALAGLELLPKQTGNRFPR